MLATDVFQSFKDADLNNAEQQAVVGRQLVYYYYNII